MRWLAQDKGQYDLIFVDPPTFSNTKKSTVRNFDVQEDQVSLLTMCLQRLEPGGVILFSNNYRGFKLDERINGLFSKVEALTEQTIPPDFARKRIHQCWKLTR